MISLLWDLQFSAIIIGEVDFRFWENEDNSQATLSLTWKKMFVTNKNVY